MYTNEVTNSFMLHLYWRRDFYNFIFKSNYGVYMASRSPSPNEKFLVRADVLHTDSRTKQWYLVIVQLDAQILFNVFIYIFIVLYMFRACHAHHQEKQIVSIQLLVIFTPCWWQCRLLVGSKLPTNTEWQLPEAVLIQFVSPDDEHDMLETCREL